MIGRFAARLPPDAASQPSDPTGTRIRRTPLRSSSKSAGPASVPDVTSVGTVVSRRTRSVVDPKKSLRKPDNPVCRHHDQFDPRVRGTHEEFRRRFPAGDFEFDVASCQHPEGLLDEPLHLTGGVLDEPRRARDEMRRLLQERIVDDQEREPTAHVISTSAFAYLRAPRELSEKSIGQSTRWMEFMIAIHYAI